MEEEIKFIQHLQATNDTNGNPRRVYVFYDDNGDIIKTVDEGYQGFRKEWRGIKQLPEIKVMPSEYKHFAKWKK